MLQFDKHELHLRCSLPLIQFSDRSPHAFLFSVVRYFSTLSSERKGTVDESTLRVTSLFQRTSGHSVIDHIADSDEEVLVALDTSRNSRALDMVFIFGVLFRAWTTTINRIDTWIQLGVFWPTGLYGVRWLPLC